MAGDDLPGLEKVRQRKGVRGGGEIAGLLLPLFVRHRVCAFPPSLGWEVAALASPPFSPELQPPLCNIGEGPNFTMESVFWELAAMSSKIYLVTINRLILKVSWV